MTDQRKKREKNRSRAGFSLIEIMVVVMIMGMLASLVGVAVMQQYKKAQHKAAILQMKDFETALDLYYTDNSRYPTTDQGLKALVQAPTSSPAPKNYPPNGYLRGREVPKDPWGNDYIYFAPGANNSPYSIESYGADGLDGGEAENADIESGSLAE